MNPTFYAFVGGASMLPMITAAWAMTSGNGAGVLPLVAASVLGGIVAVFFLMGHVAHMERPAAWKAGWIAALALGGAVTAPLYWTLYVRPQRTSATG